MTNMNKNNKIQQKQRKNTSCRGRRATLIILSTLILTLFSISFVSSADWDNLKTYDEDEEEITLYNLNVIGLLFNIKLAEYTLDYNTDQCLINCYAEGTAKLYQEEKLFSSLDFKGSEGEIANIKGSRIYLGRNITTEKVVIDYKEVCGEVTDVNGTYEECITEKVDEHIETRTKTEWKTYEGETLEAGEYYWRIEGTKNEDQSVDWITTAFGKELDNWAWWSASWIRKKEINITENSGITFANYSVLLNLSVEANMYGVEDLRFTNSSEDGELNHWVYSNTTNDILVWVKIPTLAGGIDTQIYVYYDNAGASSTSDITTTFIAGTDCEYEDPIKNNWFKSGNIKINTTTDYQITGDRACKLESSEQSPVAVFNLSAILLPEQVENNITLLEQWVRPTQNAQNSLIPNIANNPIDDNYADAGVTGSYAFSRDTSNFSWYHDGGFDDVDAYLIDTWYHSFMYSNFTDHTNNWTMFNDDNSLNFSDTGSAYGDVEQITAIAWIGYWQVMGADNIILRKHTNPEPTYVIGGESIDTLLPVVTLHLPVNNSISGSSNIEFNCSATDGNFIQNVSLYIGDTLNYTVTDGVNAFTELNITLTLEDEDYNWTCDAYNNLNLSGTKSERFFSVDTINPNITIIYPTLNNSNFSIDSLNINFTRSDLNLASCWYSNDTYDANITLPSCGNLTSILWADGQHNATIWVNDSAGNENYSRISFTINLFTENSQTFNTPVVEQSSQTFSINTTYDTDFYTNVLAQLVYDGTSYSGTKIISGDDTIFNRTITVSQIASETNFTFYWTFELFGDRNYKINSTFLNQTVNPFKMGDCNTEDVLLYNFTIVDEKTQATLVNPTTNTSAEIHLELFTSNKLNLLANYSQNFTKTNPFSICVNSSLAGGEEYLLDAQVQYTANGYAKEYYHIQSAVIDSSALAQNITLYDLDNVTSTTFYITYKDDNFLPLSNALIQIQRKFVSDGLFRTVEIPKTDSNGRTIAHLEEEDVFYTFIVVKDGEILATFDDFLVKCEDPVLGTCEISINAFKSSLEVEDFINQDDISFTLSYNRTTRVVESIFAIPSGTVSIVTLNTTLADGLGTTVICSDSLTTASGTLTCEVPTSFGNSTILVNLMKDNQQVAFSQVGIQQSPRDLYGANLMFLGMFLILMMIGVGLGSSPMISGIFLIVGGIMSIAFNLVANTGFFGGAATFIWLVIAVVVILIKGAKRE